MSEMAVIYTTCKNLRDGEALASAMFAEGHVACVNMIPGVLSMYEWEGEQKSEAEVIMLFKCIASRQQAVMDSIKAKHPYDCPALWSIRPDVEDGDFVAWVIGQTSPQH